MADTYTVERSITIDAPPEAVYPLVSDFRQWQAWSPWEGLDPAMERTYSGPAEGVGATYSWSGNRKAGVGRMEILTAERPRSVTSDLRFDKPFKSQATQGMEIEPQGSGCRVRWTMTGEKTPMVRVMSVFRSMDKMVGPDFERGLANLKRVAESGS